MEVNSVSVARIMLASYPGSLFFESLVHTDYACVHFSQHSWEIVIFQYILRFTDPAHVIENEAVLGSWLVLPLIALFSRLCRDLKLLVWF